MESNTQQPFFKEEFHYLPFVTIQNNYSTGKTSVYIIISAPLDSNVTCEREGESICYKITITTPPVLDDVRFIMYSFIRPYNPLEGANPQAYVYVQLPSTPGGPKRGTVSLPDNNVS